MAQINCIVGDLEGNARKIIDYIGKARDADVDLVSFPELALTGYPPEDLLYKKRFIEDNLLVLQDRIKDSTEGMTAVVGFVDREEDHIYNAAAVVHDRKVVGVYHKMVLPNYGVFDELRYFRAGREYPVFIIGGVPVGVNICEDIWHPLGPCRTQAIRGGAELIVNINSSPYYAQKWKLRERMLVNRATENSVPIAYNNMVGGQDELVFDGHAMVVDAEGRLIATGKQFSEDLVVVDIDLGSRGRPWAPLTSTDDVKVDRILVSETGPDVRRTEVEWGVAEPLPPNEEVLAALTLGTRDYVGKNGFQEVVIGLSGGVDSALTAAIAVDALGADKVVGVYMPSRYSSTTSAEDAEETAANMDIRYMVTPMDAVFESYLETLQQHFEGLPEDVTEENIQARVRGNILMALSNKFGWLVLSTGNKSETSVGYATLYGDMAGGFAVIKDVPKTLVYELCRTRNSLPGRGAIPERVLTREPTAELRPDQRDADSLPPYKVLDPILEAFVEQDKGRGEIVAMGFERELVERIVAMVDRNEYKRRQAPPGIRITPRAFGKDRRMPITNHYRGPST
jgi:NAD+ synthase (glutamine-hydrolysing)